MHERQNNQDIPDNLKEIAEQYTPQEWLDQIVGRFKKLVDGGAMTPDVFNNSPFRELVGPGKEPTYKGVLHFLQHGVSPHRTANSRFPRR